MIELASMMLVGFVGLYGLAGVADRLFGQTRDGGNFGPNRTTIIESWVRNGVLLATLAALAYLYFLYLL